MFDFETGAAETRLRSPLDASLVQQMTRPSIPIRPGTAPKKAWGANLTKMSMKLLLVLGHSPEDEVTAAGEMIVARRR